MLWKLRKAISAGRMLMRGYCSPERSYGATLPNGRDDQKPTSDNRLKTYFENHVDGRGIWKWKHYFDIYDRHFRKFVGKQVHVLEIGVYSGGSLDMWKSYFGAGCCVYGVDIEESCREYEDANTKILIGDQEDRGFWRDVKLKVPTLDIVVDDGGHQPRQQIVSIEEMLPHLRPGGVYVCEDVHGDLNEFASYAAGLAHNLNAMRHRQSNSTDPERRIVAQATSFQAAVDSVHLYPYAVVVEKTRTPVAEFVASKHGSTWKPHLS